VSKKAYLIRNVTLAPSDSSKIAATASVRKKTLRSSGIRTIAVTLPAHVAKQLRKYSPKQLFEHVQFLVRQWRDVTTAKGYDAQMIGQSDVNPALAKYRGKAPTSRALAGASLATRAGPNAPLNPPISYEIGNFTPFNLTGSMAGTNCMDGVPTTTVSMAPEQTTWIDYVYPEVNQGSASSQSSWQNLTKGTVDALVNSAETNAGATSQGVAAATWPGLVGTGANLTGAFLTNLIGNIKQNECRSGSQYQTWTMSWEVDSYSTNSVYYQANWSQYAQNPTNCSGCSSATVSASLTSWMAPANALPNANLALYPGAQSSVQWNWNNGYVNMAGPGGSYFSGGLTAITQVFGLSDSYAQYAGNMLTALTFDDTLSAQYGPIFNGTVTSNVGSSSPYPINCVLPPDAELFTPFPGASSQSFSNPSPGVKLTGYTTASFMQNSGSGWTQVPNSQSNSAGFAGGSSSFWNLNSAYNASYGYGCVLAASAQVPNFPAADGGLNMNLGWNMYPAQAAVAPSP